MRIHVGADNPAGENATPVPAIIGFFFSSSGLGKLSSRAALPFSSGVGAMSKRVTDCGARKRSSRVSSLGVENETLENAPPSADLRFHDAMKSFN